MIWIYFNETKSKWKSVSRNNQNLEAQKVKSSVSLLNAALDPQLGTTQNLLYCGKMEKINPGNSDEVTSARHLQIWIDFIFKCMVFELNWWM